MTWTELIILAAAVLCLAGSAWASGMETGLYRLNRIRLGLRASRHERLAVQLQKLTDRPTIMVATIMVLNNLMNFAGTTALDRCLAPWLGEGSSSVLMATIIITTCLFIFAETLPKDFFATYADTWVYRGGWILIWLRWLLCPVVWLVAAFGRLALKLSGTPGERPLHGRDRLRFLVQESVGYGLLSQSQSKLADRVMALGGTTVDSVMIPWGQVVSLRADEPLALLRKRLRTVRHWHVPVLGAKGIPTAQLDITAALGQIDNPDIQHLSELTQPLPMLPQNTSLRNALNLMRTEHASLAAVTDQSGRPVGLVSIRDLMAPLLGDIRGV